MDEEILNKVFDFRAGEYEYDSPPVYCAVQPRSRRPTFQRYVLPPSSGR
jgi:hypothetical protein